MALAAQIARIAQAFSGTLGVTALNLTTGDAFHYQSDLSFYPASTIKLPLLYEVFRGAEEGRWRLDDQLTLTTANMVAGSGVLVDLTPGLQMSIRDVATLMIVVSDNTATNMLVDLCTTQAVNRSMAELGITGVQLNRKIGLNVDRPLGEATPAGMARLMELIASEQVLTPWACDEMMEILRRQKYKELTNRFIPETDSEDEMPAVQVASKSGWVRGVRNEVAMIWAPRANYVLSIFSKDCKDRRYYVDNEGSLTLARISEAVYESWGKM